MGMVSELIEALRGFAFFTLALLWEQSSMDVRQNTTIGDSGIAHELVQFLIIADGELNVAWNDSGLLVVAGGISGEFQDFSAQVLEDGGGVDWGTSSDSLSVSALLEESGDSADWELQSGSSRS